MRFLRYTAIIAAAVCLVSAVSCGHTDGSSSDTQVAGETTASGENAAVDGSEAASVESDDEKVDRLYETIKDAQVSNEAPSLGSIGDVVSPDEDEEEAKLGEYFVCDDGVKLYYDKEIYPTELILTLKEYFKSFSAEDFTGYTKCTYPSYIEGMDAYLRKEYGYDLKKSFTKQCVNLENIAGGKYTVTRVRIEPHGASKAAEMATLPEGHEGHDRYVQENDPQANIDSFFNSYADALGADYQDKIKKETDKLYDMDFYVMIKGEDGTEKLLLGEYEIIFAEKDGRFYTFG